MATIVLAAGSGVRLGTRKQFLPLVGSERLVDRVVASLDGAGDWSVVVLPADVAWDGRRVDAVVAGGTTRLASVRAALACLPASVDVVVIGDAAHPLIDPRTVRATIAAVRAGADCAVTWLEAVEVVQRRRVDGSFETIGREGVGVVQSPSAFRRAALDAAHATRPEGFEDSALIAALGGSVVTVPGDPGNLHVVDDRSLDLVRRLSRRS